MYFKLSNGVAFLIVTGTYLTVSSTQAEELTSETLLTAQPVMCVALTQGRTCYANVTIKWDNISNGNFCIFQKSTQQQIKCWNNLTTGVYHFEFQSQGSVTYQLVNEKNHPIAETTINVSWVHKKSPRKRRWRLF